MGRPQVWTIREGWQLVVSGPAVITPVETRSRDGRRVVVQVIADAGVSVSLEKSEKKSA